MQASAKEAPPNNMKNINFDVHSIKLTSTLWAVHEDHEVFLVVKVNKDIKMTHEIRLEKGKINAEIQGKQIRGIDLTIKDQPSLEPVRAFIGVPYLGLCTQVSGQDIVRLVLTPHTSVASECGRPGQA